MTLSGPSCWHCGEALPAGVDIRARVAGETRAMCCHGCKAAAEWIDHLGLADYYRLRTAPGSAPRDARPVVDANDDDWDVPDRWREVTRELGGGLRESLLLIEGMHCTACVWLIERALGSMPGVVSIQVNAVARRARVPRRRRSGSAARTPAARRSTR